MKREITKNNKGITLIALVVTIVILIILAGISINMLVGENGIITKAEQAKAETLNAQIYEEEQMNAMVSEIESITSGGISAMYEDLAGDEEGATAGKIHIGDYINYNPNPDNLATSAMTEENGYKYVSSNDATGLSDAIGNGDITTNVTSQDFTVQSGTTWRVLGIEGNNLLIIPETTINPDTVVGDSAGYYLYGAKSYENFITEINNISKIYANGKGADKGKTRGMTIEDVNKITGVTAMELH